MTAMMMASAGKASVHQAVVTVLRASATIRPRLGVGGWVPRPRNDSDDSVRIAHDSASVICTTIGALTLGSTCRSRIRRVGCPAPAAP